jgi:anthranilate phosphoribosyltransferase
VREGILKPEDLGLAAAPRAEIVGGDAEKNAAVARSVLEGAQSGARTAVLMNAAAACWVAGLADSVRDGVGLAARAIDSGAARTALVRFAAKSQLIGAAQGTAA